MTTPNGKQDTKPVPSNQYLSRRSQVWKFGYAHWQNALNVRIPSGSINSRALTTGSITIRFAPNCFAAASCLLLNTTVYAEEPAEQSPELKPQHGIVLPQAASSYIVPKSLLLAAGSDAQQGVPSQPVLNSNSLPGEKSNVGIQLQAVTVRAKRFQNIGPMPGLSLTKEQIPGNIQSISAKEIKEAQSLSISDLLNSKLQSINVNDYQGNPFQMDVTYRGFTASPQLGSPQGLSVFFDGIRVNEPFGDIVNWDMIPMNALGGFDLVPGSNPLYGLNTLGGALTMKTKSGFDSPGVSAQVLTGSFGRKQLQASGGWNNGTLAAFGAINLFMEDGWRQNSPSKVNQGFGKVEWQGERLSLGLSALAVVNKLVGNGTVPQELYRQDPTSIFTSPDETRNRLLQFQIQAAFDVNDNINITGQVYNRDSKRKSNAGDIIDRETFYNADSSHRQVQTRRANPGETIMCGLIDTDRDGIPDYIASEIGGSSPPAAIPPIPEVLSNALKAAFAGGVADPFAYPLTINAPGINLNGDIGNFLDNTSAGGITYTDNTNPQAPRAIRLVAVAAPNLASCGQNVGNFQGGILAVEPQKFRDGAGTDGISQANPGENGSGVIAGTPTAIINKTNIDQSTQGAAMQLNFNYDQHKAMVGASIDRSSSSFTSSQRLGLLDNQRAVFSDPSQLGEEFYAASNDIPINDFSGKSTTKSLYTSETWSPTKHWNFTASARYNYTDVMNKLAPRLAENRLNQPFFLNKFFSYVVCPGTDLSECPYDLSKPIDAATISQIPDLARIVKTNALDKEQTESFTYRSLNPAFGATWQAKPNLNLYTNWNQGTRAPSVIELGCAYDDTLVPITNAPDAQLVPRSLRDRRGCSLPSALSGDPYLPQVQAKTIEFGARGKFKDFLEWNISAYRTSVSDDIYLTSLTPELSFFQSIGDTRRQGIEFGMAGEYGKSDFRINYSLTDATFQSDFRTLSPNNSTRGLDIGDQVNYQQIDVRKGSVMPGVPFNNMNFNWGYKLTPKLKMNFTLVAHSGSFLRGNENNAHTPTQSRTVSSINGNTYVLPGNEYDGTAPGYAVLNFSTRYDLGRGWAAAVRINNLLDKQYYTAGRLGINPFAPSTLGAIGPGGFNYNSNEWIPSQFISGGAPRGIWVSLSYDFNASKKYDPPPASTSMVDPDRTLELPSTLPTKEEMALMRQMETIKALPVLNRTLSPIHAAKLEVMASVESWRKALSENNAEAYLNAYTASYAPPGNSRNKWAEQQKLQLVTRSVKSVEVNDLVVAPQGKRMVAVFTRKLNDGQQIETVRKVLTFEQKQGLWQITREHALPALTTAASGAASTPTTEAKAGTPESTDKKPKTSPEGNQQARSAIKPVTAWTTSRHPDTPLLATPEDNGLMNVGASNSTAYVETTK